MSNNLENKVPFDPGFGQFINSFASNFFFVDSEVRKVKDIKQRKMRYKSYENALMKICDNLTSFYFGAMLYGAYLANKYKTSPKEIEGNDFLNLDLDFCKNSDVTIELKTLEKFIKNNDKNPFATKRINPKYISIIDTYIDFIELNQYFINVKTTEDIKIPAGLEFVNSYSEKELDELYQSFMTCINAKQVELLFSSKYFELF